MHTATQATCVNDSWQTRRNARTLQAFMALRNSEIGARLRELRGEKPQTTVAEELGVAERTYQNWEAGDAKPSYRNLQRLAAYFGVGEEFILAGEGTAPPVANGTPTPFAGQDALAARLDAIERALREAREERDEHARTIQRMLDEQDKRLVRQDRILDRIEAKLGKDEQTATTMQTAAAKAGELVDEIVQRVEKGELRVAPPASKRAVSKTAPKRNHPASS